ncbi:Rid family detoxifying hydrolase [Pseudomonas asiatica]|uniref:Rid family detoxifying hydrolase n=1 Tax=Pseudomonas asiatica TaxID=2219225 RepID=UPI001E3D10F1|nr:Rid family detoxifying hydrolase [Pseudomonas asiatica]
MTIQHIIAEQAPAAIGTYSHAVRAGDTLYLSGQVPLDPTTMKIVEGTEQQIIQAFENVKTIVEAAGGKLENTIKVNIFLTDLSCFALVNQVMGRYFKAPYPARAAIGVAALPLGSEVEIEAVVHLG